jgi:hypothetical protein
MKRLTTIIQTAFVAGALFLAACGPKNYVPKNIPDEDLEALYEKKPCYRPEVLKELGVEYADRGFVRELPTRYCVTWDVSDNIYFHANLREGNIQEIPFTVFDDQVGCTYLDDSRCPVPEDHFGWEGNYTMDVDIFTLLNVCWDADYNLDGIITRKEMAQLEKGLWDQMVVGQ